jgi:glycosyltransferase involved in cell wall biosynthesis
VAQVTGRLNLEGGVWTALRMRELIGMRQDVARAVLLDADVIVSLTRWVTELLQVNGVPRRRIVESAHGITPGPRVQAPDPRRRSDRIRIAHLGRVDPVKGTRLLIDALRAADDTAVALHIFGIVQGEGARSLLGDLQTAAGADDRITFHPPLAADAVIPALAGYDLVAIPSQWLETGPLVLLEAFAAGVPVIGSDLGGIADKIAHGVDGILVRPHDSAAAWAAALRQLAAEPAALERLRENIRPPRSIDDVAADMARVYHDLPASSPAGRDARPAAV